MGMESILNGLHFRMNSGSIPISQAPNQEKNTGMGVEGRGWRERSSASTFIRLVIPGKGLGQGLPLQTETITKSVFKINKANKISHDYIFSSC